MELDELVTKIINHIDDTKKDTIREVKSLIDESIARSKNDIIQEVHDLIDETKYGIMREINVLLEEQRAQFNTFAEGLDTLRDQMNRRFNEFEERFDKNDSDHRSLKLMVQEPVEDQAENG